MHSSQIANMYKESLHTCIPMILSLTPNGSYHDFLMCIHILKINKLEGQENKRN